MATQDDYIKTALRLPRDLHTQLQVSAEKNKRSMNAEIIAQLDYALLADEVDFEVAEVTEDQHRRYERLEDLFRKLEKAYAVIFSIGTKVIEDAISTMRRYKVPDNEIKHIESTAEFLSKMAQNASEKSKR